MVGGRTIRRCRVAILLGAAVGATGCTSCDDGPARGISPNLVRGREVSLLGAGGDPVVVTDGRLAIEGTPIGELAVALPDVRSAVVVDLGAPRHLGALLLQAGAADIYFVETSTDGVDWRVRWRVPPVRRALELRTRTTVLARVPLARWVRVRPTTSVAPAVSELQVFGEGRPAFPGLDVSPPGSALPPWPALTRERLAPVYETLAVLMILLAGWSLHARCVPGGATRERVRRGALVTLALVSLGTWPYLFNFHYPGFVHTGELFHYYLGSKYFPELGYTRLYACTVVVDSEDGVDLGERLVRDLRDNRPVPARTQLERAEECRARFSAERWEAFRRDVGFFRTRLGREKWFRSRNDHGFNATPAWALIGGALAHAVPASGPGLTFLALIDVALLAAIFPMIGWAFGLESACIAAGFFGLNALSEFGWTGGSFLRYDWLLWLVAGVAALRTGRTATAGFALTTAALLRVFPGCALFGLGLKGLHEAVRARSARPLLRHRRLVAGAAAAGLLFLLPSAFRSGGPGIWAEFARNSAKHLDTQAANFVGLQVFLAHRHDSRFEIMKDPLLPDYSTEWKARRDAASADTRPERWAASAAVLVLLALAVRAVPDWAAAVTGLGLMPLAKLSGYYYSGWIVYATLWALAPAAGFALAVFAWVTRVIPQLALAIDEQYAWLSLATVAFAAALAAGLAWRATRSVSGGEPPN